MSSTALLIIDVQEALAEGAHKIDTVLANLKLLITSARSAQAHVVYVQHNHSTYEPMLRGNAGWQVHHAITPQADDVVIEKEASDAFYETKLKQELQTRGINTLVIAGMQTEYCVDATVRSALSHEFDVVLASDAHTTGDATLSAEVIIAHHNELLPNVVHPKAKVTLLEASAVTF